MEQSLDQGVGGEIKRLRNERDWSMARLAVEADMSVSGVSMIENGKRNLTTTTLAKLARAFGVEVADLFPKAQTPLWLPEPLEGREDAFREAREGLDRFCTYWEGRSKARDITRQEFEDLGETVEGWVPMLTLAFMAERTEIISSGRRNHDPHLYETGSEILSLSQIWAATERFIELGETLARVEQEMYGVDIEAEKRRDRFEVLEGLRNTA